MLSINYDPIKDERDGSSEINLRSLLTLNYSLQPWLVESYNCIYLITNLNNSKRYVGQASRLYGRFVNAGKLTHLNSLKNHDERILYRAVRKHKSRNFKVEVLIRNVEDLNYWEKYYVNKFHTCIYDPLCWGYNMTYGGDDCSQLHNRQVFNKGMETRIKIYGNAMGQCHTPEAIQKSLESRMKRYDGDCMGQCHTPEAIQKQLDNHGGVLAFNTPEALKKSQETRTEWYGGPMEACQYPEARKKRMINGTVTQLIDHIEYWMDKLSNKNDPFEYMNIRGRTFYRSHLQSVISFFNYLINNPRWKSEYTFMYSVIYDYYMKNWPDWTIKNFGDKNVFKIKLK